MSCKLNSTRENNLILKQGDKTASNSRKIISTSKTFALSESLPSVSFHKPLVLLHQRADRLKTTILEN